MYIEGKPVHLFPDGVNLWVLYLVVDDDGMSPSWSRTLVRDPYDWNCD